MRYDRTMREEALKNKVTEDFFPKFDCTNILGNVDFSVCVRDDTPTLFDNEFLVWGEAKRGVVSDFRTSFAQLILTIGKEKTFDRYLPPQWLCEFDAAQIAFIPYSEILAVFYENDFNWNVTPSDHGTREFRALYDRVKGILDGGSYVFSFDGDESLLKDFIKANLKVGKRDVSRRRITKNNFISIYNRWLDEVKPSIAVNWEALKKKGILDSDFYLADIMSKDNVPIMQKLHVLLVQTKYVLDQHVDESGLFSSKTATFNDEGVAHARFWIKYERPPRREYQEFIIARRDLLVPQDVRERKGSYFTPQKWVELSQRYLEMELGEDWQQDYYIWDCAAGTGNLLVGLQDKYRIWASTLDQADVDVMKERARKGANLLESHVFRFDFLNDSFDDLPEGLRDIINNPLKRNKLVLYINPPYAEASNARTVPGSGDNRKGLSVSVVKKRYQRDLGRAANEIFAQFFARITREIPGSVLAVFSTLKILQGPNFSGFRRSFPAKLEKLFLVPANTFDNVSGRFPIGFQIWKTSEEKEFVFSVGDVYDADAEFIGTKSVHSYKGRKYIIDWLRLYYDKTGRKLAYLRMLGTDFQNNKGVFITLNPSHNDLKQVKGTFITENNLIEASIYFAVRLCMEATWLNDRDQFLYPEPSWGSDREFITNCLVFTLFHGQNRVSCTHGINHWIPFTEREVGASDAFRSHFMTDFISGRGRQGQGDLFVGGGTEPLSFSREAQAVMDAARELWRYYHSHPDSAPDASLYDIKEYFQGRNERGTMNGTSVDDGYTERMSRLKAAMRELKERIAPKVYEHGFLMR